METKKKKILMAVVVMAILVVMAGKSLACLRGSHRSPRAAVNRAFDLTRVYRNVFPLGSYRRCDGRSSDIRMIRTVGELGLEAYDRWLAKQASDRMWEMIEVDREREEKARQQKAGMIYGVKINEATSSSGESKKIEKLQRENEKLKNDIQAMKDKAKDEQIEKLLKENTQLKKEAEIAAEEKARLKEGAENLLAASKELLLQRTPTAEPKAK